MLAFPTGVCATVCTGMDTEVQLLVLHKFAVGLLLRRDHGDTPSPPKIASEKGILVQRGVVRKKLAPILYCVLGAQNWTHSPAIDVFVSSGEVKTGQPGVTS